MRPQPLICVSDVEASSRWYQRLLNCQSAHGGPNYERLVVSGKLVLQLHSWDVEHHHGPRHRNPPDGDGGPNHWEFWLRDLDGYKAVLASPDGTANGDWQP
jgi:hypothetical protein